MGVAGVCWLTGLGVAVSPLDLLANTCSIQSRLRILFYDAYRSEALPEAVRYTQG